MALSRPRCKGRQAQLKKALNQSSSFEEPLVTVSRESGGDVRGPRGRGSLAMNLRAMPGAATWHMVALS